MNQQYLSSPGLLKHLVVECPYGWCNRLRLIYSGLRVTEHYGAGLTIVFPEGDLRQLLELPDDIEVVQARPSIKNYTKHECHYNRQRFDFSIHERVYCLGYSRFDDESFPQFKLTDYPRRLVPAAKVLEQAELLRSESDLSDAYVGMHIRRGDHYWCRNDLPDGMVIDCLAELLDDHPDQRIALACEELRLCCLLKELFGDNIVVLTSKKSPWNGQFTLEQALLDFAELLTVAGGRYVIGTSQSSFSQVAVGFNGSPECRLLGRVKTKYI